MCSHLGCGWVSVLVKSKTNHTLSTEVERIADGPNKYFSYEKTQETVMNASKDVNYCYGRVSCVNVGWILLAKHSNTFRRTIFIAYRHFKRWQKRINNYNLHSEIYWKIQDITFVFMRN